ncbi:hypothetical protein [Geobacillus vulcani]|uniref:hypothetical protein n=1 Tax=Geobacillus vulcani TaxID=135517 RepID=UPI0004DEE40B|nr:hypothetical protein [Geobacillus vulcani]
MSIFRLIILLINVRIKQQYSLISKYRPILNKLKPTSIFTLSLLSRIILSIIGLFALIIYFYNEKYSFYWECTLIMVFIGMHFFNGLISYRRTHTPILVSLFTMAPRNARTIHNILLIEEILWLALNQCGFYLAVFIFFLYINKFQWISSSLAYILLVLVSILLFIISNKLFGMYVRNKIINPIGIFRFFAYFMSIVICFLLGFCLVKFMLFPLIATVKENIDSYNDILNDNVWNNIISILEEQWLTSIIGFIRTMYSFVLFNFICYQFKNFNYWGALSLFFSGFFIYIVLFFTNPKFIDENQNNNLYKCRDFLHFYCIFLRKLNYLIFKNDALTNKEVLLLERNRWIVSPVAFSLIFITLESSFYFGFIFSLINLVKSTDTKLLLIFTLNLLILTNHCFELREEFPVLFLLSAEKNNINLFKISARSIKDLYIAKKRLMQLILFIPFLIVLIVNSILYIRGHIYSLGYLVILIALVNAYWITPLFQLYMSPMFAKFNYTNVIEVGKTEEEAKLYLRAQGLPRKFILLPFLVILYMNLFISFPNVLTKWLLVIFFLYFMSSSLIFAYIAQKVIQKGISKIEKEVIE